MRRDTTLADAEDDDDQQESDEDAGEQHEGRDFGVQTRDRIN